MSIDTQIDAFFEPIGKASSSIIFYSVPLMEGVEVKLILVWLALAAVFFTLYLGFINIRFFGRAVKLLFGEGMQKSDNGEITQFQALMASLSGTVGLGNISGVAIAISVGGPGAVFWMTVMGFLGMSSKFAEVMLGVKYRIHPDENNPQRVSGGPMYYLKEGFSRKGLPSIGKFMAGMFAVFCIIGAIGGGNMYQANQAFEQVLVATTPDGGASFLVGYGWAAGLVLSLLVGAVILGGLKSIASVASKLVPAMALLYLMAGLVVIFINIDQLPSAFGVIIKTAFSMEAGIGGLLGGILIGVQRAAFSNEAALGSASIVQSTTKTDGPVGTGIVAMLGPFIDTIVICNVTALVIVITGVYTQTDGSIAGVALTSMAFESVIPSFKYALTGAVLLFAYSTMISWYYCGAVCFRYLFGENDKIENLFKVFFCSCIVVGASAKLGNLIDFADAAMMSMAIPNVIALYIFAPEIKKDVKEYVQALKKS
ncbi:MAG: alanine/glycine:cation symporter family protein [Alphaproteobacteria bacterium]